MRLDALPVRHPETGERLAVVETPAGSRNKYDYDETLGVLRLKSVLPAGMVFPHDFGFLPRTRAGDGDPLDVLVLADAPLSPGCVLAVRLIGAIEAEQRENGACAWTRNNRLLAVAAPSHDHAALTAIDDLGAKRLDEIEAFFVHYDRLKGVEFRVIRRSGAARAEEIAEESRTQA